MDEEAIEILEKFAEHLSVTNPITYMFRFVGWMLIKGLAWIIDGLENVLNQILGLKSFYSLPGFLDFIHSFQPILVILFAFNIMYIGYLLIFNKKFNREGVLTNVIMALIIIVLLGSGMQQADRFATQAIDAIDNSDGMGTTASKIVKDNITDLALLDVNGWETIELEESNQISEENILNINITEPIKDDFKLQNEESVSDIGQIVLKNGLTYNDSGSPELEELENGWFTMFEQHYYRWSWDFWNAFLTLGIVGVVLVTVSIKMAKLFFELAFNYALASLVAPSDMHNGQKMKQVIQNILSIFIVMIMIFLSMKIYLIGAGWIGETFDGVVYLVAMMGFAMAVIDGPNIVERLFGIDSGVKSGWSAVAGTYALARGATGTVKGASDVAKVMGRSASNVTGKTVSSVGGLTGLAGGILSKTNKKNETQNQVSGVSQGKSSAQSQSREAKENDTGLNNQDGENISSFKPEMNQKESNGTPNESNQQRNVSSLHNEMNRKFNGTSNNVAATKPKSLYYEMSEKGYGNHKNTGIKSGNFSNSQGGLGSSLISPDAIYSNNPDSVSFVESNGNTPFNSKNVEGNFKQDEAKNDNHLVQGDRDVGQLVKNKTTQSFSNNQTIQKTKRSYQIRKNTDNSIKKNIKK